MSSIFYAAIIKTIRKLQQHKFVENSIEKKKNIGRKIIEQNEKERKRINSEKTYREFVNQSFLFRNNIISKINMNLLNLTKYIYSFLSCSLQFICPIIKTHSIRLLLTSTLLNTLQIFLYQYNMSKDLKNIFVSSNDKTFAAEVKALMKGSKVDGDAFWTLLEKSSENNSSTYSNQIMYEIINQSHNKAFIQANEERLFSTLLALQFYKNRKPKSSNIEKQVQKLVDIEKNQHIKWILKVYKANQKDDEFLNDFFSCISCVPLNIADNIPIHFQINNTLTDLTNYTIIKNSKANDYTSQSQIVRYFTYPKIIGVDSKVLTFSYICFLDYVRGNQNQLGDNEYKRMLKILKLLIYSSKIGQLGLNHLCSFIFLLINCLTFYSCPNEELLKEFLFVANYLKNIYGIVGEMGYQLFSVLYKEIKIPGHAFRKKLRRDFPAIDIRESSLMNRQFHFITSNQDSFSCPCDCSLLNLRKLMIWHIMKVSYLQQKEIQSYTQMLRELPHDLTYMTYFKCMKLMDITCQLEVFQKIKQVNRQKIKQLFETTQNIFKKEKKKAQNMQIEQFDSLVFNNSLNIFRYPLYDVNYVHLPDFVGKNSKNNFVNILQKSRQDNNQPIFYKNKISLIFYGTSTQFAQVVNVLLPFLHESDLEQVRQLQIFYIPKCEKKYSCTIGDYIAKKDIWYRWFIYNIFNEKMIFPEVDLNKNNKNLFPSYLINKSVQMYLRQARRTLLVKICKCTLKMKKGDKVEIYFTQNVRIGLFAQAQTIRHNKLISKQKTEKYENKNSIQIIQEKIKKIVPYVCDVGFNNIEPITNSVTSKKQTNLKFFDIQVCSLGGQNFFGDTPDPTSNNLKMTILTQGNGRIFEKEIQNKDNFRQNRSESEIFMAFKDLFLKYSIKSLIVKNLSDQNLLKVMVDGTPYTNVVYINIEHCISSNGMNVSVPIQTFLPFK